MAVINYLEDLAAMTVSGNHELARDLDFQDDASYSNPAVNKPLWTTGAGWLGACNGGTFTGTFDGQGFTISNLFQNTTSYQVGGLFFIVNSTGVVKNLTLVTPDLTSTHSTSSVIGCIAQQIGGAGETLVNCHVKGGLVKAGKVSGIFGITANATNCIVDSCSFDGILQGFTVGGISAYTNSTMTIRKCKTSGTILYGHTTTAPTAVERTGGGIVGASVSGSLTIQDCYSEMNVTSFPSPSYQGLILGYNASGLTTTITRCWGNRYTFRSNNLDYFVAGNYLGTLNRTNILYDQTNGGTPVSQTGLTMLTNAQMKTISYYTTAGFNIANKSGFTADGSTVWFIDAGKDYPRLWFEYNNINQINYLDDIYDLLPGSDAILMKDLDFNDDGCYRNIAWKNKWTTGDGWTYGSKSDRYSGIFNGDGKAIKNVYVGSSIQHDGGIFNELSDGGIIKNLNIDGFYSYITRANGGVGTIVKIVRKGTVDNCHVKNADVRGFWAGGIADGIFNGTIQDCSFDGDLTGWYCGGIVDYIQLSGGDSFLVSKCKSQGNITVNYSLPNTGVLNVCAGGIIGWCYSQGTPANNLAIQDCYSEMNVPQVSNGYNAMIVAAVDTSSSTPVAITRCWMNKLSGTSRNALYGWYNTAVLNRTNNFLDSSAGTPASSSGLTSTSTANMKLLTTFSSASWNISQKSAFNSSSPTTWFIDENNDYPRVWFEYEENKRRRRSSAVHLLMG